MSPERFLAETIMYYSVNPTERRSIHKGACYYSSRHPKSEGCAIGRYLEPSLANAFDSGFPSSIAGLFYQHKNLLPKWMQDSDVDFLSSVQKLHDISSYWTDGGLSDKGKEHVDKIIRLYQLSRILYELYLIPNQKQITWEPLLQKDMQSEELMVVG